MGRHRYELKDSEWNRIAEMLPKEHPPEGKRGRPTKYDNRTVMNGIVWIARSGAPWRELPERYGKWQAVYARFQKWNEEKVRAEFWAELIYKYDYPANRIKAEVSVPDRVPTDRADIVVFSDDECKRPYIVVECKKDGVTII